MKISAFVAALAVCCCVSAHEIPQGVYMSIEDLLQQTPSDTIHFNVKKRSNFAIKMNGGNDYEILHHNRAEKKMLKKQVVVYSSGDSLFINCRQYKADKHYALVESSGRYLIFHAGLSALTKKENAKRGASAAAMGVMFGALGGGLMALASDIPRFCYALDTHDNQLHMFTIEFLDEILKEVGGDVYDNFLREKQIIDSITNKEQYNVVYKRMIDRYIPIVGEVYPN
ncbi:MAG: hypothetical protein IKR17_03980 [Bacteroidales bacterium]|nr:hypothetical protein [Bacteroidales bacterium]